MDGIRILTSIKRYIKSNFFLVLLISIVVVVATLNYAPGLWLTGWDTLHPEFNFGLNLKRMIFGAWRDDQGLGAVAAHSHMSDLPRILILFLINIVAPLHTVKFLYVLLCFIAGPIGIYFFVREILQSSIAKQTKVQKQEILVAISSFLAALAYVFNLGTVQHFYVVFEMFAIQYAAIGWLFFLALRYLRQPKQTTLLWFFTISFFSAGMAYASQLWFAYFGGLILFVSTFVLLYSPKNKLLVASFKLLLISLAANLFWLLPNLYFLFSGASQISQDSRINRLFSHEAFLHNQTYGTIENVALLKNFLFNWNYFDHQTKSFVPLLEIWQQHLEQPFVLGIGYFLAILVILGIVLALLQRDKALGILFLPFFFALVMIINANGLLEPIFLWLREHSSTFAEALRFPFTKFSILLMLTATAFLGFSFYEIFAYMTEKGNRNLILVYIVSILVTISLFWYGSPLIKGELIGEVMRNQFPDEYWQFYDWAADQPENYRVAVLPVFSQAGWQYHDWGYEGPGFTWFALKQPVLVRDFDRWNSGNETFYNQISHALYTNDTDSFKKTIQKYDVGLIVIDESVIDPELELSVLRFNETHDLLEDLGAVLVWQEGFLSAYDVSSLSHLQAGSFISAPEHAVVVDGSLPYGVIDPIFSGVGNYVSSNQINLDSHFFPFQQFTRAPLTELEYDSMQNGFTNISYSATQNGAISGKLQLPEFKQGVKYALPVLLNKTDQLITVQVVFPYMLYNEEKQPLLDEQALTMSILVESPSDILLVKIGDTFFELSGESDTQSDMVIFEFGKETAVFVYDQQSGLILSEVEPVLLNDLDSFGLAVSDFLLQKYNDNTNKKIESQAVTISVLTKKQPIDLANSKNEFNCERLSKGTTSKQLIDTEIVYSSDNLGAVCDFIALNKFQTPFIFNIQGKSVKGRGTKVILSDWLSNKPRVEELLSESQYNENFGVLQHSQQPIGFSLNIDTRSFGRPAQNNISETGIYLYPLDLVSGIHIFQDEADNLITSQQNITGAEIETVNQFGNYFYTVKLVADEDKQFFYLSQSYDDGWLAFKIPHSLQSSFSFVDVLPHVRYNGWANAWFISKGQHKIFVLYWPQLLIFFGFGVLLSTAVLLFILNFRKVNRLNSDSNKLTRKMVKQRIRKLMFLK